jgi:hypothetical protein
VGEELTFTATGGTTPYDFSMYSGAGSVNTTGGNGENGEYTAPGAAGTDVVRVTDGSGNTADATITVVNSGPLLVSPSSVTVDVDQSFGFTADGGKPPYAFSVIGAGTINSGSGSYTAASFPPDTTDTVRVTDQLGNTDEARVKVAPACPTNLQAGAASSSRVDLTWDDNAAGESGFVITRKVGAAGGWTTLVTLGANVTGYSDTGLTPITLYVYRVRSFRFIDGGSDSAESSWSNQAAEATPGS